MTDTAAPRPTVRADLVIVAMVVALALAALGYLLSQRQQALRTSPVGFDGLQIWLNDQGLSAQSFSGGWLLQPDSIGLLVIPLHDTFPESALVPPTTTEELLFQQDEDDVDWSALREKIARVPTLVVLPKWRSGMRLTGIAHPVLLVEEIRADVLLRRLTSAKGARIIRSRVFFSEPMFRAGTGSELTSKIYAAQLFEGSGCEPIIGTGARTLLARCPLRGTSETVLILSDPDLLNNHGLRLGDNALIARDFLALAAGQRSVVIDYSRDNWFADPDAPDQHGRSWTDLLRFFEPPFLALWLGGGLVLVLALWRSFRRAGPVAQGTVAGVGKMQAIRARARLMRLTGQDGAMLGDYAAARLAATAARLVGPGQARLIGEERAFIRFVARRRGDLALRLSALLTTLRSLPRHVPPAVAIGHVDDLEQILEQIADDT